MIKAKLLCASVSVGMLFCSAADARLYKWVDDKGTAHYEQTIPPEYADQNSVQLNNKGRVEKRHDVETPEERKASAVAQAKKLADEASVRENKRRDSALLNTYTNEQEIDLARDRSLQQVEARIASYTTMLKSAQIARAELLKEQENLTRQKRKIPASLLDDIQEAEARVAKTEKDLAQNFQELESVKNKFETDKRRFRELKGN